MQYKNTYLLLLLIITQTTYNQKALVIAPITDLIGDPIAKYNNKKFFTYATLPLESKKGTFDCKRIHQAIFNETVEILEETNKEVKVKILNCFYQTPSGKKNSTYWAQKKDFISYQKLKNKNKNFIPKPIDYTQENKKSKPINQEIITLKSPFFNTQTGQTFSAGTRFVKTNKQPDAKSFQVHIFNKNKFTFNKTLIPKKFFTQNAKNNKQKRKQFVTLIKNWANLLDGLIPYVWGGCSFTNVCKNNTIVPDKTIPVFTRPDFTSNPIPGLDCSGLVLRAAQTCNIPYYYKNTSTIVKNLPKINNLKDLKTGDLIVYPGHVIIVSDKKNNKIIEARTNEYGCGKVQEIPLNKIFKDIHTFDDLFKNKTLERIDKNGKVAQKIKSFTILSLL